MSDAIGKGVAALFQLGVMAVTATAQAVYYTAGGVSQLASGALGAGEPPSPLMIYSFITDDGMPAVKWVSLDGKHTEGGWFGSACEDVFAVLNVATVEKTSGEFIVAKRIIAGERVWCKSEDDGDPEEREAITEFDGETKVVWQAPFANLLRFGVEASSTAELHNDELTRFRARKLYYTEHQLIRAEFSTGSTPFISRCQASDGYNRDVAFALTKAFIIGRKVIAHETKKDDSSDDDPI